MIGADIHPEYTGHGFGYKAYKEFIPFIFNSYEVNELLLEVLETNKRALHLYEKLGFKVIAIKKEEVLKNNILVDSIVMSLKKEDYEI